MNTYACFIFLLATGLSAQKTEFEIDFDNMVKTVKLKDNRTLLNCSENCNEEKETACKCHNFSCPVKTPFFPCIQEGLDKLNFSQTKIIIYRLKSLNLKEEDQTELRDLTFPVSPKRFLDEIMGLYQKKTCCKSGCQ